MGWHYIWPGKPQRKGFNESFNGRLRDELPSRSLPHARIVLEAWRPDYNESHTLTGQIGRSAALVDGCADRRLANRPYSSSDHQSTLVIAGLEKRVTSIVVFHMEVDNRSFEQRLPEEMNRVIVNLVADVNLTYSVIAREYLAREGLAPDRVIVTVSPMFEMLSHYADRNDGAEVLCRLGPEEGHSFMVSAHRQENVDREDPIRRLAAIVDHVATTYRLPVIVSHHRRTHKRIDALSLQFPDGIRLLKPLGFHDYIQLQKSARAVLLDSGTASEESSILNFPALNIREANERLEVVEGASVTINGLSVDRVGEGLRVMENQGAGSTERSEHWRTIPCSTFSERWFGSLGRTEYVKSVFWRNTGKLCAS